MNNPNSLTTNAGKLILRSALAVLILFRGAAQGQLIQYRRDCGQNELIQPIRASPPFWRGGCKTEHHALPEGSDLTKNSDAKPAVFSKSTQEPDEPKITLLLQHINENISNR